MTLTALLLALGATKVGTAIFVAVMGANGYAIYHYFKKQPPQNPPKA